MEEKAIVDRELQYIADDLLTYSLDLLNQGTDEDNGGKIHIGHVLRMLAAAIHEDHIEPLAQAVNQWGTQHLRTWKPSDHLTQ